MAFDPLTAAFDLGKMAIERLWPDPLERAKRIQELEVIRQTGDLAQLDAHVKLMVAQISVNAEAAKHKSIFVAGARPAAIWMGVIGMGYAGVIYPLLTWGWAIAQAAGGVPAGMEPPPQLESAALTALVSTLLGAGTMRSVDKRNRVETNQLG